MTVYTTSGMAHLKETQQPNTHSSQPASFIRSIYISPFSPIHKKSP